jgi:hypothetical protein
LKSAYKEEEYLIRKRKEKRGNRNYSSNLRKNESGKKD